MRYPAYTSPGDQLLPMLTIGPSSSDDDDESSKKVAVFFSSIGFYRAEAPPSQIGIID